MAADNLHQGACLATTTTTKEDRWIIPKNPMITRRTFDTRRWIAAMN